MTCYMPTLHLSVLIQQAADHLLILRIVLLRFFLEKVDTGFTQCNSDLNGVFLKGKFRWRRKHICHYLNLAQGFIGVFDFRAHKFVYLYANSPPQ